MAIQTPNNLEEDEDEDEYEPQYHSDFDEDFYLSQNNDFQPQNFDDTHEDQCTYGPPPGFRYVESDEEEPLPGVYFFDDDDGEVVVSIEGYGDSDEGIRVLEIKGNVELIIKIDESEVVCDGDCLSLVTNRLIIDHNNDVDDEHSEEEEFVLGCNESMRMRMRKRQEGSLAPCKTKNDVDDEHSEEEEFVLGCNNESMRMRKRQEGSLAPCKTKKRKTSVVSPIPDAGETEDQAGIVLALPAFPSAYL